MSSQNQDTISVAEVLELPAGDDVNVSWINADVSANVLAIDSKRSKAGKPYWKVVFGDSVNPRMQVETSIFTAPKFSIGDAVLITGKGMRRTQYKDTAQIAFSKETQVMVVGRTVPAQSHAAPPPARQPDLPPASQPSAGFIPHGASVGMAVKEGLALTLSEARAADRPIGDPEFWKRCYKHSSDILRLMHTLESGRLAPKDGQPSAGTVPAETPPPAPARPPAPETPPPSPDQDEDVPF